MAEPRSAHLPALVLLAILAWAGSFAVGVMQADLLYFNIEREVVFWGTANQQPAAEAIAGVKQRMDSALRNWPDNPDYLAMQARLHVWEGVIATDRVAANESFRLALDSMRTSLAERPGNPYGWAQYAEYLTTQPDSAAELAVAVEKAMTLGAGDPKLQQRMQVLVAR